MTLGKLSGLKNTRGPLLGGELPLGTHAYVVHVELDGLGLLLVLEVVISQQVVDLIDDWRSRRAAFREARSLSESKTSNISSIVWIISDEHAAGV